MADRDPFAHIDLPSASSLAKSDEIASFDSREAERIDLLCVFFDHLYDLDSKYGRVDPEDKVRYAGRLQTLQARMEPELAGLNLRKGDIVQARVPHVIYEAGMSAEFDAGEAVRARLAGLAVYNRYDINTTTKSTHRPPFEMHLSLSEAVTVSPTGFTDMPEICGRGPLMSLHHETVDLHRVVMQDNDR